MEEKMNIKELIGKSITDIYEVQLSDVEGLDSIECFIQLDNDIFIDVPFDGVQSIQPKTLTKNAVSLFANLSDFKRYHINKDNKTVGEIADDYQQQKRKLSNRLRKFLFGKEIEMDELNPYHVEYLENKLKNIKDRKIVDFLWYEEDTDKGFLLLDNGYLITEIIVAPTGTGIAGLNYFETLMDLTNRRGTTYLKLTDKQNSED